MFILFTLEERRQIIIESSKQTALAGRWCSRGRCDPTIHDLTRSIKTMKIDATFDQQ